MKNAFFYFFIFPFYGLVQAIKNYKKLWAKDMVWLFVIFYGYTMFRPEVMDSSRYVTKLKFLYENPLTWANFLSSFYSVEKESTGNVDIYEPLVTNFVSLFTDSGNVLFAFYGITFGFFFSRNLWFVIDEFKNKKISNYIWVLFLAFTCVIGFWELNGVRMWTAAHAFFYGVYTLFRKENKKGFYFIVLSGLIHYSFALPILVFAAFYIFRFPFKILYFLFIGSFFVNSLDASTVATYLNSVLPAFLLPRVKSYTSEAYVEVLVELNSNINWYVLYLENIINYCITFLVSVIYFAKNKAYLKNKTFINFASFSLVLLIVGNVLSSLPSGGRYLLVAQLFAMAMLVLYFAEYYTYNLGRAVKVVTPFLLFFIVISFRKSLDTVSIMTVFTNPIIAALLDTPVPIIDLIKP